MFRSPTSGSSARRSIHLAGAILLALPAAGHASAFSGYGSSFRPVSMPPNAGGSFTLVGDCLADGRLIAATDRTIFIETAAGSGAFAPAAVLDATILPAGQSMDGAFLRVSPDGASIALGLGFGKPLAILPTAGVLAAAGGPLGAALPGVRLYNVPSNEGAWRSNSELALTAGNFNAASRVTLLDVTSPTASPVNPTIIANIGGASGGIAFDSAGRLFTGNGFDLAVGGGPSSTGTIRAFNPADWASGAADFETGGTLIGEVLSASGMVFDAEGNLAVGGGDFSGDAGYFGIISSIAIGGALGGGGPIDPLDPASLKRLTPTADAFAFYGGVLNSATGELFITYGDFIGGGNTWFATIPAPSAAVWLAAGAMAVARRRR